MTDRPIIFSAPMVLALLSGKKTQTRRVIKAEIPPSPGNSVNANNVVRHAAPYLDAYNRTSKWCWWTRDDRCCLPQFDVGYAVGDRLWVRENWACPHVNDPWSPSEIAPGTRVHYAASAGMGGLKVRPSIFMPRWASRITLTVNEVRVQRLQDISDEDVIAEGCGPSIPDDLKDHPLAKHIGPPARNAFAALWERLHGETGQKSWESNPWVVAVSFSVELRNIDAVPSYDLSPTDPHHGGKIWP